MRKILLVFIFCAIAFSLNSCQKQETFRTLSETQTVSGFENIDPETSELEIGADPLLVDSRGVTITNISATNADGYRITQEVSPGVQNPFKTFTDYNKKNEILNYRITQKGTYYIYPKTKTGAKFSEVTVTYTVP